MLEQYDVFYFKPAYKNNYLYDSHYKLVEESSMAFDFTLYYWVTQWGQRYLYKYDNNNNASELIEQYYNDLTRAYTDLTKYEYFDYQLVNTSIHNRLVGSLNIYPNPVKENIININISLKNGEAKSYKIYNIQGLVLINDMPFMTDLIDIGSLKQGVYFLEISTDKGEKITSKFIKD